MQKELKIGLAIGAVLLVVLIVYLAVPKTDSEIAQNSDGATDTSMTDEHSGAETTATPPTETADATAKESEPKDPFGESPNSAPDSPVATAQPNIDWGDIMVTGELPMTTTPPLRAVDSPSSPVEQSNPVVPAEPTDTGSTETAVPAEPVVDARRDTVPPSEPADTTTVPTSEPVVPAGARTHTLQKGETYASIAKAVYGVERYYLAIDKANPTLNPTRLRPGTVINLPDINAVKAEEAPAAEAPAAKPSGTVGEDEYRVGNGDSLYKIAMKRYGSSHMVDAIYEANKQTIGADSSQVKPGMVLKMPAKL